VTVDHVAQSTHAGHDEGLPTAPQAPNFRR
jgi:hypothetical protein